MDLQLREQLIQMAHASDHEGDLPFATHAATARNPLCGDELHFRLKLDSEARISLVRTQVRGCLITSAAAHAIAEQVEGLSDSDARSVARLYLDMLQRKEGDSVPALLAKFKIFCAPHPRHTCAALPAQALLNALACVEN